MKLLTIIVPVYNVENYVIECLDSIFNQWEDGIEVICINDGSTDSSLEILNSYKQKIPVKIQKKFKIFSMENSGLSAVRNFGVKNSESKYVAFLDSDDKLNSNFIFEILSVINLNNSIDIIEFNIQKSDGTILDIASVNTTLEQKFIKGNWFACARVFRKDAFDLEFALGINYEDMELVPELYAKANTIYSIPKSLYWYRYNPNGITNSVKEENIEKSIYSFCKILDKYSNIDLHDNLRSIVYHHALYISTIYINMHRGYDLAILHFNKYIKYLTPVSFFNMSMKKIFFIFFPRIFLKLYSLFKKD